MDDFIGMRASPISECWFNERPAIGQAEALIGLERVFQFIVGSREPAYHIAYAGPKLFGQETAVGRRLRICLPLVARVSPAYDFSEALVAMLSSVWVSRSTYGLTWDALCDGACMASKEAMSLAVDMMRQRVREPWFRDAIKHRREELRLRAASLEKYTRAVLAERSRTLVVRVDLSYKEAAQLGLTVDQAFADREQLIACLQQSALFEHMTGYAWTWHHGLRKGYHLHTVFFLDGSRVCRDIDMADHIGRLWQKITEWDGIFHNCNLDKGRYTRCGIGMISRSNDEQCEATVHAVRYLGVQEGRDESEFDQYMRMKPMGARTFGKGAEPEGPVRVGRPTLR